MDPKRKNGHSSFPNPPRPKRPKQEDDEFNDVMPSAFEDELAMFEEMENEQDSPEFLAEGEGPENQSTNKKWSRPQLPPINEEKDTIIFQQLDVDNYVGKHLDGMPGSTVGPVPIIRMTGVTQGGNSIMCHIHGFTPYFYVPAPPDFQQEHCGLFQEALNKAVMSDLRSNREGFVHAVLAVEQEQKENIYGYHKNRKLPFLKITMAAQRLIAPAKRILESGFACVPHYPQRGYQAYESNIDFEIRFMVDTNVIGCNWIEVPAKKYKVRGKKGKHLSPISRCQLEIDFGWDDFISHLAEGEWQHVAPLRILSFDIECAGRKGIFPEPEKDPIIQIANMVMRQGEKDPFIRNVFTLNTCAPVVGSQVSSYHREADMLLKWAEFVREVDPDIITGYNIQNFDFPYLINRANQLKVKAFPYLGRVKDLQSRVKDQNLQSKQMGRRENKIVNIEGRVQFDLLQIVLRDYKLRSYRLNAVSFHFLQEQKEDVQHSIISSLQNGNDQTRRRLAIYCMKDAILPLRLLNKLMCVINYVEMARVTGVPLSYLLSRGQQIKVISQLLRKAKEQDLLLPTHKGEVGEDYTGATVIEPTKGYYDVPIATLDFSSLYPSIMMAHNLCYTTLLTPTVRETLTAEEYIKTPSGNYFVKSSVRKGLLPEILENILAARKK